MSEDQKERQAGYVKAHYDKRKAAGDVRATIWLSPTAAKAMEDAMKANKTSKEETIHQALVELAERLQQQ